MPSTTGTLRVVVATPLSEENCALIEQLEPRVSMVRDQTLLPPMRHAADFAGDPSFSRSSADQRRFDALIDSADVLYGIPDLDPAQLNRAASANDGLAWVQIMAAGGGAQVKAAAMTDEQLAKIAFTTSAGVHGAPLAEFALFGILAGAKTLPRLAQQQARHEWSGRWMMQQVSEQTILVMGLGGIGREVARTLSSLGAAVIGTSRRGESAPGVSLVIHPDDILSIMGTIDAIVTTLPGTAATEGMIGEAIFAAAKPGLTVVNVGRGTVIDEAALIAALSSGSVGFAALDVFAVEPLPTDSLLWDHPNVLVSPHTAALNESEDRRIAQLFAHNATLFLDGEPLINRVDTIEFY